MTHGSLGGASSCGSVFLLSSSSLSSSSACWSDSIHCEWFVCHCTPYPTINFAVSPVVCRCHFISVSQEGPWIPQGLITTGQVQWEHDFQGGKSMGTTVMIVVRNTLQGFRGPGNQYTAYHHTLAIIQSLDDSVAQKCSKLTYSSPRTIALLYNSDFPNAH